MARLPLLSRQCRRFARAVLPEQFYWNRSTVMPLTDLPAPFMNLRSALEQLRTVMPIGEQSGLETAVLNLEALFEQMQADLHQERTARRQADRQIRALRQHLDRHSRAPEPQLRAALKTQTTLLREAHHRMKNHLQVVSSLFRLQADHTQDDRLREMVQASQNRLQSILRIHETLGQAPQMDNIQAADYLRPLVADLLQTYSLDPARIQVTLDLAEINLQSERLLPCGLILTELLSNALKYAFPADRSGAIQIQFSAVHASPVLASVCQTPIVEVPWTTKMAASPGSSRFTSPVPRDPKLPPVASSPSPEPTYRLSIRDNGIGLPQGMDFRKAPSLGLQLVCALTQQLRGTIELNCELSREPGTAFTIEFPVPTRGS